MVFKLKIIGPVYRSICKRDVYISFSLSLSLYVCMYVCMYEDQQGIHPPLNLPIINLSSLFLCVRPFWPLSLPSSLAPCLPPSLPLLQVTHPIIYKSPRITLHLPLLKKGSTCRPSPPTPLPITSSEHQY